MKSEIRKSLIAKRMQQTDEEIHVKSQQIFNNLKESGITKNKKRIMLYKDFRKEVQTDHIITYLLEEDHEIVLPRVSDNKQTMELYLISGQEDMQCSSYGIMEPIPSAERLVTPDSLDLILSPGVGFTKAGYRIGYGGGFYDKMLVHIKNVFVCALAFDCQIVTDLPIEAHDQKLDMIITESKIYTM